MLEQLNKAIFTQHLNTEFRILLDSSTVLTMELIEVSEPETASGPGAKKPSHQERFSILFRGPGDRYLPQAIYQFEHAQIGSFEVFIVPVSQDDQGFYYEAVFSRLRQ